MAAVSEPTGGVRQVRALPVTGKKSEGVVPEEKQGPVHLGAYEAVRLHAISNSWLGSGVKEQLD